MSFMIASAELRDRDNVRHEDHFVHLDGVTWADYERLLEIRGDHSAPRITYLDGTLEIMSPSASHESIKSMIGCLVEVWCLERDIEFTTYGSWTLKNRRAKRGAEPDECYVFGSVAAKKRPDLAIEVIWTSGGIDKLEVYQARRAGSLDLGRGANRGLPPARRTLCRDGAERRAAWHRPRAARELHRSADDEPGDSRLSRGAQAALVAHSSRTRRLYWRA